MNPQLTLFDAPEPAPKRNRQPVAKPPVKETQHDQALRFRREAAEIRAQLRQAQIDEDLRKEGKL